MIWLKTDRAVLNSLLQKKHHTGARLPVFLKRPGASEKPVNGRLIASCAGSPGPKICIHSTILQEIAPYIRDTVSTSFTFLLCQSSRTPCGEPCWQSICWGCAQKAAACADDPCEAALALVGVCNEVMVWGHHALPGTDAEVGAQEDSHICGTREAIVREQAGRSKGSMAQLPSSL